MKKTTTIIASLAIAASAAAHTTTVPHTHSAWEINWQNILVGAATIAIAFAAIRYLRKNAKGAK